MRYLFLTLLCLTSGLLYAQRVTLDIDHQSLAEALRQIDHAQQEKHLVFVFSDLENLQVTQNIHHKDALDAVRQVCQGYPILITENEDLIFIEYIKPPVHLLSTVDVAGRQIRYDESGFTIANHATGLGINELLTSQPNITMQDGKLYLNGELVRQIYLEGMPLNDQSELLQLTSDVIDKVRADYQHHALYISLRHPGRNGIYGFTHLNYEGNDSEQEHSLGAVCYLRLNKTSIYDKFCSHNIQEDDEEIHNRVKTPTLLSDAEYQMNTDLRDVNNRISVLHDFSNRHSLGYSHYINAHNNQSQSELLSNYEDYNGKNSYTDNELTLRYAGILTRRDIHVDLLGDFFVRNSSSENISLYGAGVGMDQNEAPSIKIWKVAADVQHPICQGLLFKYGADASQFSLHYLPKDYLSNVKGLLTASSEYDMRGKMYRIYIEADYQIGAVKMKAGIAPQWHKESITAFDDNGCSHNSNPGKDHEQLLCPQLRLFFPLDEQHQHNLTLSYQQEMEEIPYALLSPAVRWSDAYNFSIGNNQLLSAKPSTFIATASFWQSRLLLSVSYRKVKDEIYWITQHNETQERIFYTQPINLNEGRHLGFQAEGNIHPTSWWQLKANAQWDLRFEDETLVGIAYHKLHLHQYYSAINQFRFPKSWAITLEGYYQPSFKTYDRTYRDTYRMRCEIQKSFMDNRFQCSLVGQPLHRNRGVRRIGENYCVDYNYDTSIQTIGFRFVYNFRGRTRVKVNTVEGGLKYNEIKDSSL